MAPGCPEPLAEQAIVDSAVEFCEKTLAIRYESDPLIITSGVSSYDIEVPARHKLCRIISARIGDDELKSIPIEQLPTGRSYSAKPTMFYVSQGQFERQINFFAMPDDTYTVNINVAIKPSYNATSIADDLYDYWLEAVVSGAVSRLKQIPDQPFTDLAGATYYGQRFWMHCNNARVQGNIGRVVGSMQTQPKPFVMR